MANPAASKDLILRALPSVDQLLRTEALAELRTSVGLSRLTAIAREVTETLRSEIQLEGLSETTRDGLLDEAVRRIRSHCERESLSMLHRVINATGVILHTNLGRAPLSQRAIKSIANEASGY